MRTAAQGGCGAGGTKGSAPGIIYSGIFYFYNRIIQFNYNKPALSEAVVKDINSIGVMIHAASKNCLPQDLMADAALIDFGRAIVFSEDGSKNHDSNAKAAAQEFLGWIKDNEKLYFFQSHVTAMKKLAGAA
jgi:hypothetical protein